MNRRSSYRPSGRTEVQRLRKQLDELFLRGDELDEASELAGDMHRYLCVRVSGFLEQSMVSLARACCENHGWGAGATFGLSWLERAPNMRSDELQRLVSRFDRTWGEELIEYLAVEERSARINALMGIRNDVAHGKNQGVSRRQVWEYYQLVSGVVDWAAERLDPV